MLILGISLVLILIGLYAIITKRNMIKVAVGFALMEYAVNFLFAIIGFHKVPGMKIIPPILMEVKTTANVLSSYSDPVPQALVLTSIVIGLGVTAFMLSLALRIYNRIGSFDLDEIKRLKG
ncbi:NADH-quinone oxidoreductase subunit K [candidate division WOR-3 bacterium]|nr:NADH-quinone oxidoreductase subunit K [candidate division WOR-3 bacterium]